MARKSDNPAQPRAQKTPGAPLSILDWDDGSRAGQDWLNVAIRYRLPPPAPKPAERPRIEIPLEYSPPCPSHESL